LQGSVPQVFDPQVLLQTHMLGAEEGQVCGEVQVPQECKQASVPQLFDPQVLGQIHELTAVMLVPNESLKQQFLL
jgi:hypothetical protein